VTKFCIYCAKRVDVGYICEECKDNIEQSGIYRICRYALKRQRIVLDPNSFVERGYNYGKSRQD
jgi:hypothetical protein